MSAVFLPGQQPDGVTFDSVDGSLYFIDHLSRMTWRANWNGTDPLGAISTAPWYDASGDIPTSSTAIASLKLLPTTDLGFSLEPRDTAATEIRISPRSTLASEVYGTPAFAVVDIASVQSTPITPTTLSGDNFILEKPLVSRRSDLS